MARAKKLRPEDFAGDGGPFTEVVVTISVRILDDRISRSRLAVSIYPDPALEQMARSTAHTDRCGYNEDGVFGLCLTENFNGYEDMNDDYPRIDANLSNPFKKQCAEAMNDYISRSVRWALQMHRKAMKEAGMEPGHQSIQ